MKKLIVITTIFLVGLFCASTGLYAGLSNNLGITMKVMSQFSLEIDGNITITVSNINPDQYTALALLRFKTNRREPWDVQVYSVCEGDGDVQFEESLLRSKPNPRDPWDVQVYSLFENNDRNVRLKKINKTYYEMSLFEISDSEIEINLNIPFDSPEKYREIIIVCTITE